VALLGLSFKPNTNDIREAPSLKIIPFLHDQGAEIIGYDPKAAELVEHQFSYLSIASDAYQAITGADVAMIVIEWPELITLNLDEIAKLMRSKYFIDTRDQYDPKEVSQHGLTYIGVGR
jgi:UDPglucose 6-dehydrogenase